ncbi:chemotaxis protein CheA [Litorivicinus lipolyticus]|uniref:Chemotaxis protein CheA n=1 Tax=Litorivicinus lipolyticus TaxID=418701 RepID=A0A5Q2QD16_9GAMM|nr:chemotaxis protein CheA [Litorivicinus lipolyticus]QGG80241.1 chemotaxis protein CheA [Litorivicinus lipolyticus]
MSVDMSQFHQVFFEESLEGLDIMEQGLLALEPGSQDLDTIGAIFRAAHSIKGGSGTFGFSEVAEFTHILETLLDEIRDGQRLLTGDAINLFLQSVDCLRAMFDALQTESPLDMESAHALNKQFQAMLNGEAVTVDTGMGSEPVPTPATAADSKGQSGVRGWVVTFKPDLDLLRTGNEPVRMFRELEVFGEVTARCDLSKLPSLGTLTPEECYLSWTLEIVTDEALESIKEVFEWVEDESDLTYAALGDHDSPDQATEVLQPAPAAIEPLDAAPAPALVDDASRTQAAAAVVKANSGKKADTSIRVSTDKIDALINMVGELVITQSMLGTLGESFAMANLHKLQQGLEQLEHNTRELQESVMRIRMLPISFTFNRFPRLVRDMSQAMGKKIELIMDGEGTELDKTVMEKIGDPLVHLVRNSLDHGIEMPQDRLDAGKPETGQIKLNAFHQGGSIVIEISDDGKGLDADAILAKARRNGLVGPDQELSSNQIHELIFEAGLSTAAAVTDVSGRGVGMDVVRKNINELGGGIEIESAKGVGTTMRVRLPLTLAILDGQLVRVGTHTYIFPIINIIESLQVKTEQINQIAGGAEVMRLRDEYIPVVRLYDVFSITADSTRLEDGLVVVLEFDNEKVAIAVDDLLSQQQVVIKSLETNYEKVDGVSGATILGDGTVAMILDVQSLIRMAGVRQSHIQRTISL